MSRFGIGYIVVYGGQVFKMDLAMMGVFVLALLAFAMYIVVALIEKHYKGKKGVLARAKSRQIRKISVKTL